MLDANTQALIWQVMLEFARQHQVGVRAISQDRPLLSHRILDLADDTAQTAEICLERAL